MHERYGTVLGFWSYMAGHPDSPKEDDPMKTFIQLTFTAAASAALLATPVTAGQDDGIVVTSPAAMTDWKADMNAQLDRQLIRSDGFRDRGPMTAAVQIRFTLDAQGKPANLETVHHSGARRAAFASRVAVRNLRGFDKAPVSNARGATYQANLIFARNDRERAKLQAELNDLDRARLAAGDGGDVIMLGG